MKATGYISKTLAHKKYHELTSPDQKKYILFFKDIMGDRFMNGDVLEFDVETNNGFGEIAANPKKRGNIYLEDLKQHFTTQTPFLGFVYAKRTDGYSVSYNGYRCFLPEQDVISISIEHGQALDLSNSFQQLTVTSIKDGNVFVSLKHLIISEEEKKLAAEELHSLSKGFAFIGKVKNVKGFGVFIQYKSSQGLLHVSNIIKGYDDEMDRAAKTAIEVKLANVFYAGREVSVIIDNISEVRYSLVWDRDHPSNKEICEELAAVGIDVPCITNL